MRSTLTLFGQARDGAGSETFELDKIARERGGGEGKRSPIVVGNSTRADVQVSGSGVLDEHLILEWAGRLATWKLTNRGPSGSVSVGGVELDNQQNRVLAVSHCQIDLGGTAIVFRRSPSPPAFQGRAATEIPVGSGGILIGRGDKSRDDDKRPRVCLDPEIRTISSMQAAVRIEKGQYVVENLNQNSSLRTILNGDQNFDVKPLVYGDCIQIPEYEYYTFQFTGSSLIHLGGSGILQVRDLTRVVTGGKQILSDCTADIQCGDFVGILGGSGQGKSTLLNALCAVFPATSGEVWMYGHLMKNAADMAAAGIGYVPQDDIVHSDLTVEEALTFAAQLRLKLSTRQIREAVTSVIKTLGLYDRRSLRVGKLSGGQRKRVSIASELLASPRFLLLDEPTSGLDPQTERNLMDELSLLARKKRMGVVSTTHVLQNSHVFSSVGFIQGGRLIFFGPPFDAVHYFLLDRPFEGGGASASVAASVRGSAAGSSQHAAGSSRIDTGTGSIDATTLLDRLPKAFDVIEHAADRGMAADRMEEIFGESTYYRQPLPIEEAGQDGSSAPPRARRPGFVKCAAVLLRRQWSLLMSDKLNFVFLLSQALVIGGLVGWVSGNIVFQMFLAVIATLWFGCSNAAQEIVGEVAIFRRERLAGLGLNTYLLNKLFFLTMITGVQAVILFGTILGISHVFHPEKFTDYGGPDPDHDQKEFRKIFFEMQPDLMAGRPLPEQKGPGAAASSADEDDFLVVDAPDFVDVPVALTLYQNPTGLHLNSPGFKTLENVAWFFRIRKNVIDHLGVRTIKVQPGEKYEPGPERSWLQFVLLLIGLKGVALLSAAIVGVGLGLVISASVRSPTQAVMWVPLILIPQILFGGFVVTKPEMDRAVYHFSSVLPSYNLQRLMDIGNVYGRMVPRFTNKTKIPGFFESPPDEEETVKFTNSEGSQETKYDKISEINKSWQNLNVKWGDAGGRHKEAEVDSVEFRSDLLLQKGQPYPFVGGVYACLQVLGGWVLGCYIVTLIGLIRKQSG